jgi:Ca2+-binding RTX toxin-like protein
MKTPLLLLLLALLVPSSAYAGTATFDGAAFTYTAAPGEANGIVTKTTDTCGELAAPCFAMFDSADYDIAPPPGCIADVSLGILCPIPAAVTIEAGDKLDLVLDWDGPSTIHAGDGDDVIRGKGGDDVLLGDDGADVLIGGPGDDASHGGDGPDTLESYYGGYGVDGGIDPSDTAGSDLLFGGAANDSVSYEARTDPLTITVDGVADDGAPGENDDIRLDVEVVQGSEADDAISGNDGPNVLIGGGGDDVIRGGGGDDDIGGAEGSDLVLGNEGADRVAGGGEDDVVHGGPGHDELYGEWGEGCGFRLCVGGADQIMADDGEQDYVECGEGTDEASLDRIDTTLFGTPDCENVTRAAAAAPCRGLKAATRRICRLLERSVAPCRPLSGAKRKRCLKRAARKATASCRARFKGRSRAKCVRSVRRVLR